MSFFELVRAYPEGSSSASRMALAARSLGYRGLVVVSRDPEKLFMPEAAEKVRGIEISFGAEVSASSARALKSRISSLRSRYPFLVVLGTSEEVIRMAKNSELLQSMQVSAVFFALAYLKRIC